MRKRERKKWSVEDYQRIYIKTIKDQYLRIRPHHMSIKTRSHTQTDEDRCEFCFFVFRLKKRDVCEASRIRAQRKTRLRFVFSTSKRCEEKFYLKH